MSQTARPSLRQLVRLSCLFLVLSAAFQLRGLSPDGLLSDASALRTQGLWATVWPPGPFGHRQITDYVNYFGPYAAFIQRELRAGRLPLWNPYVATGVPVTEVMQPALFHPFTLFLLFVPFEHALTLIAVLRPAIAGLGTFVLARVLGCGVPGAIAAGVLFMFSPFHLLFRFHPLPNASVVLPLVLAASELRVRGGSARRLGAAWALLGTLMFLGGHAETSVHCLGVGWAYHLLRATTLAPRGQRWRSLGGAAVFLALATCLALLGAAVVVWGHLVLLFESPAVGLRTVFGYRRMPLSHLPSLLVPVGFSGPRFSAYLGAACLLFAARGAAARDRFPGGSLLFIGTLALLATYGVWPVEPILKSLPLLGIADHSRLLFVVHLALALLAARGLDTVNQRRALWATVAMGAAVTLALAFLWRSGRCPGGLTFLWTPVILTQPIASLGLAAVLIAAACHRPTLRIWSWLMAGLLACDLYLAHGPRPRWTAAAYPETPAALELVQGPPENARTFVPERLLPANVNMVYGIPAIAGYEPAMSSRTTALLRQAGLRSFLELRVFAPAEPDPAALRVLSLLNVRYLIARPPLASAALVDRLEQLSPGPAAVYRNPAAFPRVFVAGRAVVASGERHALALLRDPRIDLRQTVILEQPPPVPLPRQPRATRPRTSARIVSYAPGAVRVAAEASGGGYLVFSETFSPGWRARVDGEPAVPLRGDYNLVAVPLTPGRHEVDLRYRPLPVVAGGLISAATILGLLAAALRRGKPGPMMRG